MSLSRYLAELYRRETTIPVVAPWEPEPGVVFRLWVRPDDDSEWCKAREAAGVDEPTTATERANLRRAVQRREMAEADAVKGKSAKGQEEAQKKLAALLADTLDSTAAIEEAVREGWSSRYPLYTRSEVERLAVDVGRLLVERVEVCRRPESEPEGEKAAAALEVLETWEPARIAETFTANGIKVPRAFPGNPDQEVELAGYPEATAWSIVALRASVQTHLYQEREVPLGTESAGSEPEPATTEPEKSSQNS